MPFTEAKPARKPIVPRAEVKLREVEIVIIESRCKECGYCIEFCPRGVLEKSEKFNERGYHPPYVKYPELCVGCGLCERICPDFAIYLREVS
ncbi:MAG: 4Fe-4S ferredoxin [Thermoproteota archaeon]|nr:MAG: 4Fe-4S ferredoxin [Candidatus Korarchaeota archaeon]RLG55805.1 MAG: 4Fe-4S ferredoxin [Candidatus Korarchaeota archaeon]